MWKKVLIGCGVALVAFMLAAAALAYFSFRQVAKRGSERPKIPSWLEKPSVLTGSDLLDRMIFFEDARLGRITDIVIGELDPNPSIEIGVAGSRGAVFLDEDLKVKSRVMFNAPGSHVDIIDADNDGSCEFMDRGSWVRKAALIDHAGNTMWTYGGMTPGVNDMAAGDVDGDGRLEYVVGFNGWGGVHLVDENGKKIWKKSGGNVWHVEMVDTNGDGNLEIVHSNASGKITVRDKDGEIMNSSRPFHYFSKFSLCRWPAKIGMTYAMLAENNGIWLFDFQGRMVKRFNAPNCGSLGHARGTHVNFLGDQHEHLGVIVSYRHWERAVLYVYDADGKLAYQEVLPSDCQSIATQASGGGRAESLLIGSEGIVWQYRASN